MELDGFIGREPELAELEERYRSDRFEMVVVYGRRRVGKTSLIARFCVDKPHVFYVAQEYNDASALQDFSRSIFEAGGIESGAPSFGSWKDAFAQLARLGRERRMVVVIDEFPYLARANPGIPSILQNSIDHELQGTGVFLILCGSSVAFMEKEVLAYKSPLYGRRTAQMKIEPFDYLDGARFFPKSEVRSRIANYMVLGGVPLYLKEFSDSASLPRNIEQHLLRPSAYLFAEPVGLLKQELRDPSVYNSLIGAIAQGASRLNDIAMKGGETTSKSSIYLDTLIELGIIRRSTPAGSMAGRKTIYEIQDNLFRFWYRFVYPNLSPILSGTADVVLEKRILPGLDGFLGNAFEDVCRQFLIRRNRDRSLPFPFTTVSRWWGTDPVARTEQEIDLVAIDGDSALCCECKWKNTRMGVPDLELLKARSLLLPMTDRHFALFSKSGFTDELVRLSESEGVLLVDPEKMLQVISST